MILVSREKNGYGEPICTMLDANLDPIGAYMTWLDSGAGGTILNMYDPQGGTPADFRVRVPVGASKGWYVREDLALEAL